MTTGPIISFKEALADYQDVFNAQNIQRLPVTVSVAKAMEVKSDVNFDGLTMHAIFTILGVWFYASDNLNHNPHLTNSTCLLIDIDSGDKKD